MEFALTVLCFSLMCGAALSLCMIPLFLYTVPYILWLGSQRTRGRYQNVPAEGLLKNIRNATRVYLSFLTGKKPAL